VPKTIAIGCDDAGYALKEILKPFIETEGWDVADFGCHSEAPVDYPDVGFAVSSAVARAEYSRAVLICGTGIGMAITANKVPGVRAAQAHDTFSAERARKSNNAQVLTIGSRVIGPELAKFIVRAWLESEFEGGHSARKVEKMIQIENANFEHLLPSLEVRHSAARSMIHLTNTGTTSTNITEDNQ
jgi:ribose 5-phosphate isomerase B